MERKQIRIYAVHSWVNNIESLLDFLNLEELKHEYDFIWDDKNPDYLICTDQIYHSPKIFNRFKSAYSRPTINIFYASEAISPDFNLFDYSIGWDVNLNFADRFCLLPPPYIYPGKKFLKEVQNQITGIDEARKELCKKKGFCNFLYSNWCAHPMRDQLFYEISKYKHIDSLGKHLNNVGKKGTGYVGHRLECIDIKQSYKFSISSENATFSGYTSEKILTSFNAHSIPIYWGDPDIGKYFNEKAFINVMSYDDFASLIEVIKEIDSDDDLWCKMIMEPWQTPEQMKLCHNRWNNYLSFFRNIFNQEVTDAKRTPSGTMPDIYTYHFFKGYRSKLNEYYRAIKHKFEILRATIQM
ncbi:hypothetical protein JQM83_10990 [Parabacteroides distasonis]|nr:hypothetical protein [Parabacteroides distasonis]